MAPDEAADILVELTVEKSEGLLKLMEEDDAEEVRELLQYEEGTAGALMTTEIYCIFPQILLQKRLSINFANWHQKPKLFIIYM